MLSLVFGFAFLDCVIIGAVGFGLGLLYFWLLERYESDFRFWIVMVVGLAIGLV